MTELNEEARGLIDLARDTHDPSGEDRSRVRVALAARLGAAAGLGTVTVVGAASAKAAMAVGAGGAKAAMGAGVGGAAGAGAPGAAAGAGVAGTGGMLAGGTLAAKMIGTVVVAAAIGGGAVAVRQARHVPVPAMTAPQPKTILRQRPPVGVAPAPLSPPPLATEEPTAPPARGLRPPARPTVKTNGAAAPGGARSNAPALAEEARLVGDGVAALRAGYPSRALALFDAHAARYPNGALAEERTAERVLALAELGRTAEARAAAAKFLQAHPTSPLAAQLREQIQGP